MGRGRQRKKNRKEYVAVGAAVREATSEERKKDRESYGYLNSFLIN